MKKVLFALVIMAAFVSCRSATYEYEDGSWREVQEEPEPATITITIQ